MAIRFSFRADIGVGFREAKQAVEFFLLNDELSDLGLDERVPNPVAVSFVDFFFRSLFFPGATPPAGREAVNAFAVGPDVVLVLGGPVAEVAPEGLPTEVHGVDVGPEDVHVSVAFTAVVAHVVLAI